MNTVYLLLGANIGDPKAQINRALALIQQHIGPIVNQSFLYTSEAWGVENQPFFLNQVVEVKTDLVPLEVLKSSQQIEDTLGRVRKEKWGSRLIDIDILYYNMDIIEENNLQVPHPYLQDRKFTLIPLTDIAPDFIHPILCKSNNELLSLTSDTLNVFIAYE